mmetsp:Transcript_47725/g.123760  ORF Transcript_47725/g.123760 Transcript_47725/m.123760 type:complete len:225 (+) Transcript_47725:463-1137(+)
MGCTPLVLVISKGFTATTFSTSSTAACIRFARLSITCSAVKVLSNLTATCVSALFAMLSSFFLIFCSATFCNPTFCGPSPLAAVSPSPFFSPFSFSVFTKQGELPTSLLTGVCPFLSLFALTGLRLIDVAPFLPSFDFDMRPFPFFDIPTSTASSAFPPFFFLPPLFASPFPSPSSSPSLLLFNPFPPSSPDCTRDSGGDEKFGHTPDDNRSLKPAWPCMSAIG